MALPSRINAPDWLRPGKKKSTEQIANDLIAIAFWEAVDQRANAQALAVIKRLDIWDKNKSLEEQSPEAIAFFNDEREVASKHIVELMSGDIYLAARAMAESADQSIDNAVALRSVMEPVSLHLSMMMPENGWLHYLEYNSLTEYLMSKKIDAEHADHKGLVHDLEFLATFLVPALEANGYPRDLLFNVSKNFHKARIAIPYLRRVLNETIDRANEIKQAINETNDPEEIESLKLALTEAMKVDTRLHDILKELVIEISKRARDGGLSINDFRDKMSAMAGKRKVPVKQLGFIYNTPKGGVIMISASSTPTLNAVKNRLGGLVDWHLGTPEDLAKETARKLNEK